MLNSYYLIVFNCKKKALMPENISDDTINLQLFQASLVQAKKKKKHGNNRFRNRLLRRLAQRSIIDGKGLIARAMNNVRRGSGFSIIKRIFF